jgi:hypothetical protein
VVVGTALGVGARVAVGAGLGDGLAASVGVAVGLATAGPLGSPTGDDDAPLTTATPPGARVASGTWNPPRTARKPNDAAIEAISTRVAPMAAREIGCRRVGGSGVAATRIPRR